MSEAGAVDESMQPPPPGFADRGGWRWAEPWWDEWRHNVRGRWVGQTVRAALDDEKTTLLIVLFAVIYTFF